MLKALLHVPVTYTHLQDQYLVEIAEFLVVDHIVYVIASI